jgi:SUR7/PalI family
MQLRARPVQKQLACTTFVASFPILVTVDQTGLWNYCEGYYRLDLDYAGFVTNCGPKDSNYYFNPISIVSTEVLPPYTIIFLQQEADAISRIQDNSNWLKAAFIIATICTGTTVLIGPLTGIWHQRKLLNCIPVGCMCIAGIFWFSGAITATVIYTALRDSFNNDVELNIQAQTGRQMFVWVWLGAGTSCMSLAQWCCAAICCPGGIRKRRIEWRRRITGCVSH